MGEYQEIHYFNKEHTAGYDHRVFTFCRWSENEKLIVLSNFDSEKEYQFSIKVPQEMIQKWSLNTGEYQLEDQLYSNEKPKLVIGQDGVGVFSIHVKPLESFIFKIK